MWMSCTRSSTASIYKVMQSGECMIDISSGFLYFLLLLFVFVDCDMLLY